MDENWGMTVSMPESDYCQAGEDPPLEEHTIRRVLQKFLNLQARTCGHYAKHIFK